MQRAARDVDPLGLETRSRLPDRDPRVAASGIRTDAARRKNKRKTRMEKPGATDELTDKSSNSRILPPRLMLQLRT